jgi:hypothetical protein
MWLMLENGTLVNLELVSRVELNHQKREATLINQGVNEHTDSRIAYEHFMGHESIERVNWEAHAEAYRAKRAEAEKS